MPTTCIPSCGTYTDPISLAAYDLSPLCNPQGEGLVANFDPSWTINVCGTISGGCSSSTSNTFCAFPDDSVCGIDGEAPINGMIIRRNFTESCGLVKCHRCQVVAFPEMLDFNLIDSSNPGKGIKAIAAVVPLTPAQRDQRDRLGFCSGGSGRISTLYFHCDCSRFESTFERVWSNPESTCELFVDIYTNRACYDGFCQGLPPPAYRSSMGSSYFSWFLFFFIVFGCFYAYARSRSGTSSGSSSGNFTIPLPNLNLFGTATSRSMYSRFRNSNEPTGNNSNNFGLGRATLFGGSATNSTTTSTIRKEQEPSLDEQL
jgi:hypothetical protein